MGTAWIPVIDMTRDEGRTRTEAVVLLENIICELPQFVLDRLKFIWITDTIDTLALHYLQSGCASPPPAEEICGALIADAEGRYLELYWQAILQPRPNPWWEEQGVHDPAVMSLDDRLKMVVYHLLLGLLHEAMRELHLELETRVNAPVSGWPDEPEFAGDPAPPTHEPPEWPALPPFRPENHPHRLSGYRIPVNRIMHFLSD